jgi:hypothetical protein
LSVRPRHSGKAGATILAENGATTAQLMAIYDWSTPAQAEVYFRAANRSRLAGQATPLLAKWTEHDLLLSYLKEIK